MRIRVYKNKDEILVRYNEELRVAPMDSFWVEKDLISMATDLKDLYAYRIITEKQLVGLEVILDEVRK